MRLAALLLASALALSGCTSDDDTPEPTVTSTSPSASASAPSQEAIDSAVTTAIKAEDTAALRDALRQAGQSDGAQAAQDPDLARDADERRNYRILGWWADQYSDDDELAGLFSAGAPKPFDEIAQQSSLLADLATLADHVQDDWADSTGKELSFAQTYDEAYDSARG